MASPIDMPLDALIKLHRSTARAAPKAVKAAAAAAAAKPAKTAKIAQPKLAAKSPASKKVAKKALTAVAAAAAAGQPGKKKKLPTIVTTAAAASGLGLRQQRLRGGIPGATLFVPPLGPLFVQRGPKGTPRRRGPAGLPILYTAPRAAQPVHFKHTAPRGVHHSVTQALFTTHAEVVAPTVFTTAAAKAPHVPIPSGGLMTARGKATQLQKQQEQAFVQEQQHQLTTGGMLIVGNLLPSVSEQDVTELFSSKGEVKSVVLRNGTARVVFVKKSAAHDAMHEFNGVALDGVSFSRTLASTAYPPHTHHMVQAKQ